MFFSRFEQLTSVELKVECVWPDDQTVIAFVWVKTCLTAPWTSLDHNHMEVFYG